MNINNKYLRFNLDLFFYIIIGIYFFCSAINLTMYNYISFYNNLFKIIRYICYIFFLIIIFLNVSKSCVDINFKKRLICFLQYLKNHIFLCFMIVIGSIVTIVTSDKAALTLILLIWTCSFYDFEKIIKLYVVTIVIFMIFTWLSCILGIIPEVIKGRVGTDIIRYSLGYIYPLELMSHFLFLVISYIYIKKEKYHIYDFVIINIINILLFKLTNARTSFLLILFISTLMLIYNKIHLENYFKKIKPIHLYILLAVCVLTPLILSYFYNPNNQVFYFINKIVSSRLNLTHKAFANYGVSLFGQNIEWIGWGGVLDESTFIKSTYNFVDCSYAKNLFDYGIIYSIFIYICYGYVFKNALIEKNFLLIINIIIILILCVFEPRLLQISMNPFILLLKEGLLLDTSFIKKNIKKKEGI